MCRRYQHGVIQNLINPSLLRNVRAEIQNLSFTPKETDIYKIHQSGDLANLDGLDNSSLKLLPSLLTLRDAMYSLDFREYLSRVTNSGPLSGKKTDMAINVYTPGCHLLCHDDVIGSRRVSYILYLTDPDRPWKKEWGGALRLYPTQIHTDEGGEITKVPSPDYTGSIPPAFNQLSFFAVQPGESFHDVEEVYGQTGTADTATDAERVRMAISGWYHIPQEGEDGYLEGLEERLAEKSSLMQLQGKGEEHDLPKSNEQIYPPPDIDGGLPTPSSQEDSSLSPHEIDFLLKYISPTYLTPDPLKEVSDIFAEECSICLENFLSRKFSASIKDFVQSQESQTLPSSSPEIENGTSWKVARPPHKHRFLFQQAYTSNPSPNPLQEILQNLFPSKPFQKWLFITTGHQITSHNSCARRFRKGKDYTLATGYEEDSPRIELCLGITPTPGWGDDQPPEPESEMDSKDDIEHQSGSAPEAVPKTEDPAIGGYLAYMAADEDDADEAGSDHGIPIPLSTLTGARSTRATAPTKSRQDPAIYRAAATDEDDDGVLFSMPACWNRLGIVLRDRGTMRFVKYVSARAGGDRWDVVGEFGVEDEGEEGDDEGEEGDRSVGSDDGEEGIGKWEREMGLVDEDDETEHDDDDDDMDAENDVSDSTSD